MSLKPFVPTQEQVSRNRDRWGSDYNPHRGGHYNQRKPTPSLPPERRRKNER